MTNTDANQLNPTATPPRPWYRRWWAILLWVVLGLIIITLILGVWVYYTYKDQALSLVNQEIKRFAVATADDPSVGPADAPVVIVEFLDFQCSVSAEEYPVVSQLLKLYEGRIKIIYRDFPVVGISLNNAYSQKAGEAVECAQDQGKFWVFQDKLLRNQSHLTDVDLKRYAVETGLNVALFNNCLNSSRYEMEVKQDLADGLAAGVAGTPTFFINGRRVAGAIPVDVFKQLVDGELGANKSE